MGDVNRSKKIRGLRPILKKKKTKTNKNIRLVGKSNGRNFRPSIRSCCWVDGNRHWKCSLDFSWRKSVPKLLAPQSQKEWAHLCWHRQWSEFLTRNDDYLWWIARFFILRTPKKKHRSTHWKSPNSPRQKNKKTPRFWLLFVNIWGDNDSYCGRSSPGWFTKTTLTKLLRL